MWDLMPANVKNFIDALFSPLTSFLQLVLDMLGNVSLTVGRGINLNNYFSFFTYLPASWQTVIHSALASVALLGTVYLIRAAWDMYLKAKESGKFW